MLPSSTLKCLHKNSQILISFLMHADETVTISSVQSLSCVHSLWPHGLQQARVPCPSPTAKIVQIHIHWVGAIQRSHPLSSLSLPAFNLSQHQGLFQWISWPSGGQSIGVSASKSVLPMNTQDWFPLGLTGLISLQSKGLLRVFSSTTHWKHQFFCAQPSLWSNSHIQSWLL